MSDHTEDDQGKQSPGDAKRKPISARQLAANRRNAQMSTGPTSPPGKARSSRNRVDHGMYADIRPISQGAFREDPLAVQAMVNDVLADLQPRTGMERAAAMRVANIMIQIGRYHAFEAANLSSLTSDPRLDLVGPGVFDAQYNAELYSELAQILQRDPATYTATEWHDLLLGAAAFDADLAELYELLHHDNPMGPQEMADTILGSIRFRHGGSLEEASRSYAEFARAEAERLPDPDAEREVAHVGVNHMFAKGTLDAHTRILARLSAALDRELKRYYMLCDMNDQASAEADDVEDEPEM